MPSTDQNEKSVTTSHSLENAEKTKAMGAILAHLEEVKRNRPSDVAARKTPKTGRTVEKIIAAARDIFIQEGHAGLSLRKVADRAGIAVGNLTYHFPTKRALLRAMLRESLTEYIEAHLEQFESSNDTPLEILLNVVEFYVRNARGAHQFFYQMWGYAGSSEEAKETVRELYMSIGRFVYYLVRAANPKLTDSQIRQATLQIFSLEEGYKLFIGMGPDDAAAIKTAEQDIRALTERIVMAA